MVSRRWWGKFLMRPVRRGVVLSASGITWIRQEHEGDQEPTERRRKGQIWRESSPSSPVGSSSSLRGGGGRWGWDDVRQTRTGRRGRPSTSNDVNTGTTRGVRERGGGHNLANFKMYMSYDGNIKCVKNSHSRPKPFCMTKTRDRNSLLTLFREVLDKC
jgi:hypothetical protein